MRSIVVCLLLTLPWAAAAQQMSGAAPLIRQAIEQGRAAGALSGPIAEEARKRLNATGVLTLEVRRLAQFQEPGCARMQLTFTQEAALPPGSLVPAPYSWTSHMNICADGQPPSYPSGRRK